MRILTATIIALVTMVASQALASTPPPPTAMTDQAVDKWVETHMKAEGWTLIAMQSGGGVVYGGPEGVFALEDGTLRTLLRNEYFEPHPIGPMSVRSTTQTWDIDCQGRRFRVRDMTIFEENNMEGKSLSRTFPSPEWSTPPAGDALKARILKRVCEAPTTGKRLN